MENHEEQMVQEAYQHLIDTYLESPHRKKVDLIQKAFNFAKRAHQGVKRLSGEPYIMHPIAVAQIACGEIGLGSTSICAALLHDVVEDTDYTVEDIANIFGPKIAQIVDGLTKISGGIFGDQASAQAETFRKLLLTMSDDIRVILIKMSDRLHNMRTLGAQQPHKRYKIAGETLYIYAPLANRLGLNLIKEELEDLSFRYEQPEAYEQISQQLDEVRPHLEKAFNEFIGPIKTRLDQKGFTYTIKARIKRPYSIWQKMQSKHIQFDEIYDLLAARIIFEPMREDSEVEDCFQIYAACTSIYQSHPERFRDWLSHPKSNGYRALHTTLMSRTEGRWIELQIRSVKMDDMAERGFAAHWKYKNDQQAVASGQLTSEELEEGEDALTRASDRELDRWLSTIKELLDDPQPSAMDFLSSIKLNLYASEILVITPKGEFRTMPTGSTALDFAFSIHSFLGTHCIGAKVNHQLVPISYTLKSGDQVEILTSEKASVDASWLNFATTGKAHSKIEAILRRQSRELQHQGEDILTTWLVGHELEYNSAVTERLVKIHNYSNRESLFEALGNGSLQLSANDLHAILHPQDKKKKGWKKYIPFLKSGHTDSAESASDPQATAPDSGTSGSKGAGKTKTKSVILTNENLARFTLCPHCRPIAGDLVLGYLDQQNRVVIHKRQCPIANQLKASEGNRIIAAEWDTHKLVEFTATIHIEGIDKIGLLRSITDVLTAQLNVNMRRLILDSEDGIVKGDIELCVRDTEDVQLIVKNLKKIQSLKHVIRVN